MDDDWYDFMKIITNNSIPDKVTSVGNSGQVILNNFFKSKSHRLKWKDIKKTLRDMDKLQMVKDIEEKFLYTLGKSPKIKRSLSNRSC